MSQYLAGTATVTNGSATVTGTNTLWSAYVTAGDSFTVAGDGVMYDVASVDSDTQVTLSVAYAGVTASGVVYAIGTGFTVPDSFPEMSQGDIETATIFTRAMRKIQGKFSSILTGGANANFTAMPQVGGDPIVESGSNSDGEWTRWSDGTQIVTSTVNYRDPVGFRSYDGPVAFLSGVVNGGGMALSNELAPPTRNIFPFLSLAVRTGTKTWGIYASDSTPSWTGDIPLKLFATGRWK